MTLPNRDYLDGETLPEPPTVRARYEQLKAAREALLAAPLGLWFDSHAALCRAEDAFVEALEAATGLTRAELVAVEEAL